MHPDLPDVSLAELEEVAFNFDGFSNDDAVNLGLAAVEVITEWGLNLAVDIILGDDLVFRAKLGTTGPDNDPWLAGKAAVARTHGVPSLLVRRRHEAAGTTYPDVLDHAACVEALRRFSADGS